MGKPTILEVAQAAGVGIGTVSRAINRAGTVKQSTTEAVQKAMRELGYVPPSPEKRRGRRFGQAYPRKSNLNIMLMIVGDRGLNWMLSQAPVYASVIEGIEKEISEHGINLQIRHVSDWQQATETLNKNSVRGVILFGSQDSVAPPPDILQKLPCVWVMGSPREFKGDHIQPDHTKIGILAAEYLLQKGHRHCAYLGSSEGSPGYHVGFRGATFRWAIEQAGGAVEMLIDPELLVVDREHNVPNEPVITKLFDRLAGLSPRPTAMMIQADMLAPMTYRLLQTRGVMPQKDMTVVTCNNERPYLISLFPPPVIIDLHAAAIGRRAVDQLLWRREHPNEPAMRIMLEPFLIDTTESKDIKGKSD